MPEGLDTLEQFYVIYVRDLTRWDDLDKTEEHKDELKALRATLSLCVNTYRSSMTFGVMNTQLLSQEKNLNWQIDTESNETPSSSTVTHGGDRFWMSGKNRKSFHDYLSIQTFAGSARMRSASRSGGTSGGNFTENEIVRRIAASLYNHPTGIQGLTNLLDNLTMSMSNAYVSTCLYTDLTNATARLRTTTDTPDNLPGTSTSFEVYIQIEWAWMSVPIATSAAQDSGLEIIVAGSLIGSEFGDTK
ncbi:MAG: hypothetical protein Q9180_005677 [Flavoplaca navasiana]